MSVTEHRRGAPVSVRCFVLTVSDTRIEATDSGGDAIADLLQQAGHVVSRRALVRDDPAAVAAMVREELALGRCRVFVVTGGTGIARRDTTYEALVTLFDKEIVGFGELFRMLSYQEIGSAAMLSRATAGIAGNLPIFLLPGSEHAVRLAMTKLIIPELGHVIGELQK
ncbi:MAG: molybdenum cofactor biosynthesis protein B [Acidobacteriota bacterium]